MIAGCCIGGPFGIIGVVLALIGWRRKRPLVEVNVQAPMMTTDDIYKALQREQYLENEEEFVPRPFTDVEEAPDLEEKTGFVDQEERGSWENWDNG